MFTELRIKIYNLFKKSLQAKSKISFSNTAIINYHHNIITNLSKRQKIFFLIDIFGENIGSKFLRILERKYYSIYRLLLIEYKNIVITIYFNKDSLHTVNKILLEIDILR